MKKYGSVSTPRKRPRLAPPVRKSARKYAIPTQVKIGKQAFPKQLFNTITYFELVTMDVVNGTGKHVFSANGCYDPNITGTGHQPLYFDQISALYDHYTALRSRITVWCTMPSGSLSGVLSTLYIDDDTSTKSTAADAAEMPGCAIVVSNPSVAVFPKLYQSWDAAKVFGPNPQAQDSLQGTAGSNPTEQSYFILQMQDSLLASYACKAFVKIEYDVVWDELTTIASS